MMKYKIKLLTVILAVFVLSVLLAACAAKTGPSDNDADAETTTAAQSASSDEVFIDAFTTQDLNGETVTDSILANKDYTMINVWGTFCGPCINEMPQLEQLSKNLPDNMQMIGVICDLVYQEEDAGIREDALRIVDTTGVTYQNLLIWPDAYWFPETSNVVPTTYFVDSEGKLVGDVIFGADIRAYKDAIDKLR